MTIGTKGYGGVKTTLLITSFIAFSGFTGVAETVDPGVANAPAIVLPDALLADRQASVADMGVIEDQWVREIIRKKSAEKANPNAQLVEMIRSEISEKYGDSDVDTDRLAKLIDGSYLDDYMTGSPNQGPVQFSNGHFNTEAMPDPSITVEAPVEQVEAQPAQSPLPANEAFGQFLMTPEGMQAIAGMSQDQIKGIAYLMQAMSGGGAAPAQSAMNAIPGLDDENIGSVSPDDLLRSVITEPAPRVVEVGDGQTMGLADWLAKRNDDGTVSIENTLIGGSSILVSQNMVVGQFGRVAQIVANDQEVFVEFETGDRILGTAPVILTNAVPGLNDDLSPETATEAAMAPAGNGEIIVSIASPRPAAERAQAVAEEAEFDVAAAPEVTEKSAFRPVARPASAVEVAKTGTEEEKGVPVAASEVPSEEKKMLRPQPRPETLVVPAVIAGDAAQDTEFLASAEGTTTPVADQPSAFRPKSRPSSTDRALDVIASPTLVAQAPAFRPFPRPRRG